MPLTSLSQSSATPAPQYLSVVPSDRSLVEKHSPGALAPSQELKFFQTVSDSPAFAFQSLVSAMPVMYSTNNLFYPTQGVGATQRVGRSTTLHLWSLRMQLKCSTLLSTITPPQPTPAVYRVVLGVDHQPDPSSTTITVDDLFATLGATTYGHMAYQLPFNPVNEQRFTILYDNYGHMGQDNHFSYVPSVAPGTHKDGQCLTQSLEFKTVLKVKGDYPSTSGSSVTERPFLFVMLPQTFSTSTGADVSVTRFQAAHNFRFTD